MAYGYPYQPTYFNTNYAPPMPPMNQPGMMQAQPQQQQPPCNVNWIYVNGYQGAREHIVQPGQTAWMMDNNDPIIYVKAVDNMGSASLRAFRLDEIGAQQVAPATPNVDTSQFATHAEVDELAQRLNQLVSQLAGGETK